MARATSAISRLCFSSSFALHGSKGTPIVSHGIAAKWNTVVAPIRLRKWCGSTFGLSSPEATPSSIIARKRPTGVPLASISGDTTGGARSRLPRALELHKPAVVILELGGNDGLRGLPLRQVRENFQFLIERGQAAGARVVLVGMRMPPNYGAAYADGFHALYGELAGRYGTPLVEFFLEGVALDEKLMQADGIHPTAAAQPRLLDNLWPALQKVLKK